jgi:hypothetical protein
MGNRRAGAIGDVFKTVGGVVLIAVSAFLDEVAVGVVPKMNMKKEKRF